MDYEIAVSEIIGAVLLISILVAAFAIFSAIYIPTLVPDKIPEVTIGIACSNTTDPLTIEFPCIRGSFSCYPDPYDYETCEKDCQWRDYSTSRDLNNEQTMTEISRCMENCISPICSNLSDCKILYVCHNGGDPLPLNDLSIFVNSKKTVEDGIITSGLSWGIKKYISDNFTNIPSISPKGVTFYSGDSLRILNPSTDNKVNTVNIYYSLPSGGKINLVTNQFGTDIK